MAEVAIDPLHLEGLLTHCIDFAKQMLHDSGEFYPFGAMIRSDGSLECVGAYFDEEHPHMADAYRLLQEGMKSHFSKKEIVAAAIAANGDIPADYRSQYPDGIRVLLECKRYARFFYLPYRLARPSVIGRLLRRKLKCDYGDFFSVEIPPELCGIDSPATNG